MAVSFLSAVIAVSAAAGAISAGPQSSGRAPRHPPAVGRIEALPVPASDEERLSLVHSVNDDGNVIVGRAGTMAAIYRVGSGMQRIEFFSLTRNSTATGVNGDGTVVVGFCDGSTAVPNPDRAFVWTKGQGLRMIGCIWADPMATSYAYGVSRDGTVVVGSSVRGLAAVQPTPGVRALVNVAFRWTAAGGMQDLGFPDGGNDSTATDVSADGTTVVGTWTVAATGETRGFCWTAAQGMVDLGVRGGPVAVSGDGGVVVGSGAIDGEQPASLYRGFRWTRARGATRVPGSALFGGFGAACDVSADGALMIGTINCGDTLGGVGRWSGDGPIEEVGDASLQVQDSLSFRYPAGRPHLFNVERCLSGDGSVVVARIKRDIVRIHLPSRGVARPAPAATQHPPAAAPQSSSPAADSPAKASGSPAQVLARMEAARGDPARAFAELAAVLDESTGQARALSRVYRELLSAQGELAAALVEAFPGFEVEVGYRRKSASPDREVYVGADGQPLVFVRRHGQWRIAPGEEMAEEGGGQMAELVAALAAKTTEADLRTLRSQVASCTARVRARAFGGAAEAQAAFWQRVTAWATGVLERG